jgi:hypothetical protein
MKRFQLLLIALVIALLWAGVAWIASLSAGWVIGVFVGAFVVGSFVLSMGSIAGEADRQAGRE